MIYHFVANNVFHLLIHFTRGFYLHQQNIISTPDTSQILSLKNDYYLDSHRFRGIPFFPFVMGMEYLFQSCSELHGSRGVLFWNYSVENPLHFRKDCERKILIEKEMSDDSNGFLTKIVNESGDVYISSSVVGRKSIRKNAENDFVFRLNSETVKQTFGNDIYETLLPHGAHFHNNFDIIKFSKDVIWARQYNFNNNLEFFKNVRLSDLALNPALLDGVLQLAALHAIKFEKTYILPSSFSTCFINLDLISRIEQSFIVLQVLPENTFNVSAYDEDNNMFLSINDLKFSVLKEKITSLDNIWSDNDYHTS